MPKRADLTEEASRPQRFQAENIMALWLFSGTLAELSRGGTGLPPRPQSASGWWAQNSMSSSSNSSGSRKAAAHHSTISGKAIIRSQ